MKPRFQYRPLRLGEISSSYIQSRRFHVDQLTRDMRELGQLSSYGTREIINVVQENVVVFDGRSLVKCRVGRNVFENKKLLFLSIGCDLLNQ